MTESDIQARILLAVGALPGVRLFRNTAGEGWQGQVLRRTAETVTLANPRYVVFGLAPGSPDLVGWCHGRFLGLEVKTPTGRPSDAQRRFIDAVNHAGGVAGIVRSPDDALRLVRL